MNVGVLLGLRVIDNRTFGDIAIAIYADTVIARVWIDVTTYQLRNIHFAIEFYWVPLYGRLWQVYWQVWTGTGRNSSVTGVKRFLMSLICDRCKHVPDVIVCDKYE